MKKNGLLRRVVIAAATGALTLGGLALADTAAADVVNGGALVSGTAVTTSITVPNRQVSYTFAAEKGRHVAFSTSASTWSANGSAGMFLYVPVTSNGKTTYVLADSWVAASGKTALYDFTPNTTGVWKLQVSPGTPTTTGSTTFTFANDVDKGTLAVNTATPAATTVPGQNIVYYFKAVAAEKAHISLDVTASGWGTGGTANGYIYTPGGVLVDAVPLASAPTYYDFTPNADGYWKFVVDPDAGAVGGLTLAVAADQKKGQLQTNTAVTASITAKGSRAIYGVYGEAGEELPISVSATNWGTNGSAYLFLFPAASDTLIGFCALTSSAVECPFYPPADGAYRLVVDPQGGAVGSTTFKRLT
ncbi:hypothetical protein [Kineosporia sp. NBRC 101731]|uniref:hypothetical protein n=1 Tax=Kineosporia sp. NBRC 101731 TaxID=3032199 RepID=UPI0024A2DC71|nr:hypothetical protein [Kineosporia sp. NBRC 101731]GLY27318.1 hypothetical protein Kisp02_06830 [Kineosporia sp. NBRC 101731]